MRSTEERLRLAPLPLLNHPVDLDDRVRHAGAVNRRRLALRADLRVRVDGAFEAVAGDHAVLIMEGLL